MYLDKGNEFEPGTTLRTNGLISENVVDGVAPGIIEDAVVAGKVVEAFNNATSVECQVVTADNAALSTNPVVLGSTGTITLASGLWALGKQFFIRLKRVKTKRYTGLKWVIVGTAPTTGKVQAQLSPEMRLDGEVFLPGGSTATPISSM